MTETDVVLMVDVDDSFGGDRGTLDLRVILFHRYIAFAYYQ